MTPEQPEPRLTLLEEPGADERERAIFARARHRYGWVPNTIRAMAHSASAAELYLDADERNGNTTLSALAILRRAAAKHLEPAPRAAAAAR